jgi:hypothetical protein
MARTKEVIMNRVSVMQVEDRHAGVCGVLTALNDNPVKNKAVIFSF